MLNMQRDRETAPFTLFYRSRTREGGYGCDTCHLRRHDTFGRLSDVSAVAMQHLNICRGALRHRPIEGTALVDGTTYGVVLREGVMILALPTTFCTVPYPTRLLC